MRYFSLLLPIAVILGSCHSQKKLTKSVVLDVVSVSANNNPYNIYRATSPKLWEIENTKLALSFNWKEKTADGVATITLHPYFYPADTLMLDAKSMKITSVIANGKTLKFTYKEDAVWIFFSEKQTSKNNVKLTITYTAMPYATQTGGSIAIRDDRGLYFINTDYSIPGKPAQIWTQGESESNSHWFPTIDKPNQRSAFDIALNVPDSFQTLSNGTLIDSKKAGTMRTDTWRMDKPIQVYAAMFAIGKFAIIKDKQGAGKDVSYYVEKEYAPYAKLIFKNTPDMIDYFSDITGTIYPWNKYSQVVVRDYVSGAMENTSASLFGEFVNQNARENADKDYEDVVSHELFHQWFGDYVTFESWSNLTLSESFATYGEYLWRIHKYGDASADELRFNDLSRYLAASDYNDPPLVRFYYRDKEDMFDRTTYQKGGAILHYLHALMGDEAFYKTMKLYLGKNALRSAEATQWRLAAEEVTGRDWTWFFNQWYLRGGHPILEVQNYYDDVAKKLTVTVTQKNTDSSKLYILPMKTALIYGNEKQVIDWNISDRKEVFTYPYQNDIKPVVEPDVMHWLVGEMKEKKQPEQWLVQYKACNDYISRRRAIANVFSQQEDAATLEIFSLALKDSMSSIRSYMLERMQVIKETALRNKWKQQIAFMAINEGNNNVRANAFDVLGEWKVNTSKDDMIAALTDSSYNVAGAALSAINDINKDEAYSYAKKMWHTAPRARLQEEVWEIVGKNGSDSDMILFEQKASYVYGVKKLQLAASIAFLLDNVTYNETYEQGLRLIVRLAATENIKTYRQGLGTILFSTADDLNKNKSEPLKQARLVLLKKYAQQIIDAEMEPEVKTKFKAMYKEHFDKSQKIKD